jgi:hypothetical protein
MAFLHACAMKSTRTRRLVLVAVSAAVLAGGGTAAALASGSTPAHAADQPGLASRCAHVAARLRADGQSQAASRIAVTCIRLRIVRLLLHTIHGQFTVQTPNGVQTIALERGVVQSVGGGVLTVKASDGTTWNWDLVGSTVVRQDGNRVDGGALAIGQHAIVIGPVAGGANDARLIIIRTASAPAA